MGDLLPDEIHVIELHMMEMKRYFPLTAFSNVAARSLLYPFHVVRTHLQTQVGREAYSGSMDAFRSIRRQNGIAGFYRGLPVHLMQVIPGLGYIFSYEKVRSLVGQHTQWSDGPRTLVAGAAASVFVQCFNTPVDVVSQHIMLIDKNRKDVTPSSKVIKSLQQIHIPEELKNKRFGIFLGVVKHVYNNNGFIGFFRGYSSSMFFFAPNSALFWFFYEHVKGKIASPCFH